jgi:5,6-dimethylbenzimidazole synthase
MPPSWRAVPTAVPCHPCPCADLLDHRSARNEHLKAFDSGRWNGLIRSIMQFSTHDTDVLTEILRWRRDVRHFKTDAIAPDVLERVEAAVDLAPSVGNSRPWRMVRVTNAARRAMIAAHFEAENSAASDRYDDARQREYLALKLAGLRDAPVHIAVFTEPDPRAGQGLGRQTMPETLAYSTVLAIHTYWLAATVANLGVGWVSILDPAAVTDCLDVPKHWEFTGYLCVGYPVEASIRPELERVGWQANIPTQWMDR